MTHFVCVYDLKLLAFPLREIVDVSAVLSIYSVLEPFLRIYVYVRPFLVSLFISSHLCFIVILSFPALDIFAPP